MNARTAVGAATRLMRGTNQHPQLAIPSGVSRGRSTRPGIEATSRDVENLTQMGKRHRGLLRLDERESYSLSLAKKAAAFLRNSLSDRGVLLHGEAERLCATAQVGHRALTIPGFIVRRARVGVCHAIAQRVVEEDRDLACGGRHGLGFAGPGPEAAVEGTQRGVRLAHRDRGQAQQGRPLDWRTAAFSSSAPYRPRPCCPGPASTTT